MLRRDNKHKHARDSGRNRGQEQADTRLASARVRNVLSTTVSLNKSSKNTVFWGRGQVGLKRIPNPDV
jgi:hypothetical protein